MGFRLATLLRESGEAVVILDLPSNARKVQAAGFPFRPCDIRDPEDLRGAFDGVAAVVHLAAVLLAREDAALLEAVNHLGTANVLRESGNAGIRLVP